ncbi:MAG: isoprenylcysteine carboxylmethyltransferase family protein, partial [Alphaproteobacteria bacterium]
SDIGGWSRTAVIWLGLAAVVVCILGRCWCTLFIGGRKSAQLVDIGPYSMCRNPLYFFSFLGAFGFGAQIGSLTVALAATLLVVLVFIATVRKEEAFLTGALGEPYLGYLAKTPRFIPNPALWRTVEVIEVRPRLVTMTFVDGLLFLLGVPLALGAAWLHAAGVLPVLISLP